MARVFTQASAIRLGLPGRTSIEIVSGALGAKDVTLRLVAVPLEHPGVKLRGPHHHTCEECIFVLSGSGKTLADSGEYPLATGDTILIPAGENHVTRNTGTMPLLLLCFYPTGDIAGGTIEPGVGPYGPA